MICWQILSYDKTKEHRRKFPIHSDNILTTKHFCSEEKFINLAKLVNKYNITNDLFFFSDPF
jgi:hypothetical protein